MQFPLMAGELYLQFDRGRLVDFCYGGVCVLKEIYFALRDENWGTIPFVITEGMVEQEAKRFQITFQAEHEQDGILFWWNGNVVGGEDSVVTYSFEGTAGSGFKRNRLGFCVLHPDSCAGERCTVTHWDGTREDGAFPYLIAPHQPFFDIKSISGSLADQTFLDVEFDGEVFEMEDQRNWTDASFKTYCTPLRRPFPVAVHKDETVCQSVKVSLKKEHEPKGEKIPSLGCCIRSLPGERQQKLAEAMRLSHLRYDYFFETDAETEVLQIAEWLEKTDTRLVLAVHFPDDGEARMKEIWTVSRNIKNVLHSIIVYGAGNTLPARDVAARLKKCRELSGVLIGSGTDAFFTQLNRRRPDAGAWDFVSYSNNPQVHAFDDRSVMETVRGQRWNLKSCRALYQKPIYITPITMKMRWNPDATKPLGEGGKLYTEEADARQTSFFLAVWTLKSICMMTEEKAALTTYYELTGACGVMEEEMEEKAAETSAGAVYPVFLTLSFAGYYKDCRCRARWNEKTAALYAEKDGKWHGLVGNCTDREQGIIFERACSGFFISEENRENVGTDPERIFNGERERLQIREGSEFILPAYSMLCVDFSE